MSDIEELPPDELDDAEIAGGADNARARKAPNAFRTISEVADDLHIPQHVLRFWESKFPQVKPLKRGGGRRYYRPDDIALLKRVADLLYTQGYTIKGVQRLLRETGGKLDGNLSPPLEQDLAEADDELEVKQPAFSLEAPAAPARAAAAKPEDLRKLLTATLRELESLRQLMTDRLGTL
jgi:DNA-binding transcriptional MerR regulator